MKSRVRFARGALLAVGLALATGCGGAPFHMRAATTAPSFGEPPEGRAQVVFLMPGRSRDVVTVVDQRGTYYGQLREGTVLVRDVPPGRYRFYAIRDRNGWAVEIPRIEAGQTAYLGGYDPLLTSFVWRSYSGCDEDARQARAALPRLARVEPDPAVPVRTVLARVDDLPRRTDDADRDFAAMTPAQRALRTIDPDTLELAGRCDGESAPVARDAADRTAADAREGDDQTSGSEHGTEATGR